MPIHLVDVTGAAVLMAGPPPANVVLIRPRATVWQQAFPWATAALIPAGNVVNLPGGYLAIMGDIDAAVPATAAEQAALPAGLYLAIQGAATGAAPLPIPDLPLNLQGTDDQVFDAFMDVDLNVANKYELTYNPAIHGVLIPIIFAQATAAPFEFTIAVGAILGGEVAIANSLMAMADSLDHVNGDKCAVSGAGEKMVSRSHQKIMVPFGCPVAPANAERVPVAIDRPTENRFLMINTYHLLQTANIQLQTTAAAANPQAVPVTPALVVAALKVAVVRFLTISGGLASPVFAHGGHNCQYNDTEQMTAAASNAYADRLAAQYGAMYAAALREMPGWIKEVVGCYNDMVCITAYFFRVRGHHYLPDFAEAIARIFRKTTHPAATIGILPSWCAIMTCGLHAIYPDILDTAWIEYAAVSQSAGALAKRVHSAPAGMALPVVVARGLTDIRVIFPGMRLPEEFDLKALQEFVGKLTSDAQADRWVGSINRRFYAAPACPAAFTEAKLSVMASIVLSVYRRFASGAKLIDSAALQRGADANPVVGGVIGQMGITVRNEKSIALAAYGVTPQTIAAPPLALRAAGAADGAAP